MYTICGIWINCIYIIASSIITRKWFIKIYTYMNSLDKMMHAMLFLFVSCCWLYINMQNSTHLCRDIEMELSNCNTHAIYKHLQLFILYMLMVSLPNTKIYISLYILCTYIGKPSQVLYASYSLYPKSLNIQEHCFASLTLSYCQ